MAWEVIIIGKHSADVTEFLYFMVCVGVSIKYLHVINLEYSSAHPALITSIIEKVLSLTITSLLFRLNKMRRKQ